jgi:hypothetical protein
VEVKEDVPRFVILNDEKQQWSFGGTRTCQSCDGDNVKYLYSSLSLLFIKCDALPSTAEVQDKKIAFGILFTSIPRLAPRVSSEVPTSARLNFLEKYSIKKPREIITLLDV